MCIAPRLYLSAAPSTGATCPEKKAPGAASDAGALQEERSRRDEGEGGRPVSNLVPAAPWIRGLPIRRGCIDAKKDAPGRPFQRTGRAPTSGTHGGRTRTCDLRAMDPVSFRLLYPAMRGSGCRARKRTPAGPALPRLTVRSQSA